MVKNICLLFKESGLWYFVMAAHAKTEPQILTSGARVKSGSAFETVSSPRIPIPVKMAVNSLLHFLLSGRVNFPSS